MKQIFRVSLLALCAISLMGSCKRKGKGEPKPNTGTEVTPGGGNNTGGNTGDNGSTPAPNPPANPDTTPVDATKAIKLVLKAGQTSFSLSELYGANITMEGTDKPQTVTPWKYSSGKNNPSKVENYVAEAGTTVLIKGNISELTLSAGEFEKIDLSTAPVTFTTLRTVGAKVKELDLSGVKGSLRLLSLQGTGLSQDYDLSEFTSLLSVYFDNCGGTFTLPRSIRNITCANHFNGINNAFTSEALPQLAILTISTCQPGKEINFSGSSTLKSLKLLHSKIGNVNVQGAVNLEDLVVYNCNNFTEINANGCVKIKKLPKRPTTIAKNQATHGGEFTKLYLSGINLTDTDHIDLSNDNKDEHDKKNWYLSDLDLSNNKLTKANFTILTTLKKLNLKGNPTLTGEALSEAIRTLPQAQEAEKRTLIIEDGRLSEEDKNWLVGERKWAISYQ